MKSKATVVKAAEMELAEKLGKDGGFYHAGVYDDLKIVPLRLRTTYDEAKLLFFERSLVRPEFVAGETEVIMPILFFKVDGDDQVFQNELHQYRQKHNKQVVAYSSFRPLEASITAELNSLYELDKAKEIAHLSQAKKDRFKAAVEELIQWQANAKLGYSDLELANIALASAKIIDAFHYGSAEKTPAKVIISDNQKNSIGKRSAIRIYLAHLLGLDVCIISKRAFASIENYLAKDSYDHFIVKEQIVEEKKGWWPWSK